MILTDFLKCDKDITWSFAKQCGVNNAVIKLPEDMNFDITDFTHWKTIHNKFMDFGIKPIVIEPLPNMLNNHIKTGDSERDECIEKVIIMLKYMNELDIRTLCFNFMAHIGWLRTDENIPERGNAYVTGFDINEFKPDNYKIRSEELWNNYIYFIKSVIYYAEKYNIKLALHPDDPPVAHLGDTERIMISYENIKRAVTVVDSPNLGITMCQATFFMMGEDLYKIIHEMKDKIFFIHFRNAKGYKYKFRETFHDNGMIDMAEIMKQYKINNINVPVRVDHVPLMAGEKQETAGYTALGRLYAIGYLKGILETLEMEEL